MQEQLIIQAKAVITELTEKAKLKTGDIVVIGCSTSEIIGSRIGTNSSPDTAKMVFEAIYEVTQEKGVYLAAQCCEHLNRAIIIERQAVPFTETVNAIPQPKAGGSFATQAYQHQSICLPNLRPLVFLPQSMHDQMKSQNAQNRAQPLTRVVQHRHLIFVLMPPVIIVSRYVHVQFVDVCCDLLLA